MRQADVTGLLEVVSEAHSHPSLDDFREGILPGLRRLTPCDVATYNEIEFASQRMVVRADPEGALFDGVDEIFVRLGRQNPLIARFEATRDGRAYKWSDVTTRTKLHQTELYARLYEPMGVEYQMAFTLPSEPELLIGLALNRGRRDFSERDRTVLNLLRPHLIRAYRNVLERELLADRLAVLDRGLALAGHGIVLLNPDGGIEFLSARARELLDFGSARRPKLPADLLDWLRRQRAVQWTGGSEPLVLNVGRARPVVLRYVNPRKHGEPEALLVERAERGLESEALRALGLTAREADVLRLLALGHANKEIASELGIGRRTVEKHLEHVFAKLGVGTRGAAAATAWAGVGITRLRAPRVGATGSGARD